jgi:cyanophycinase
MKACLAILFISACFTLLGAAGPSGHLVIIGGGDITSDIDTRIIDLAGGPEKAFIMIIPYAGADPQASGKEYVEEFKKLGCNRVEWLELTPNTIESDAALAKLNGVTGIFFSGGDQSRLTKLLNGTRILAKIHDIYARGGVISGTSAGAAIMSRIMITGNELINRDQENPFKAIQAGNVETTEGFGLVDTMIIDQHFILRRRHNRLISVVLTNPQLLGVGIDERNAIVVNPDRTFEVMGPSAVLVYDATHARDIHQNAHGYLGASNLVSHILLAGDRFDLAKRQPRNAKATAK